MRSGIGTIRGVVNSRLHLCLGGTAVVQDRLPKVSHHMPMPSRVSPPLVRSVSLFAAVKMDGEGEYVTALHAFVPHLGALSVL